LDLSVFLHMMVMAYSDSPFNLVALLFGWLTRAAERGS
jgi:hypothetical protein